MDSAYSGQRVLVVGMARSGLAAGKLLLALGARVILCDARADVAGVDELAALGAAAQMGQDGADLVPDCDLLVVSPGVPLDAPVIQKAQALGVPVLSELALAAGQLSGETIAVTGTNGKTTTVTLIGEMLKNAGKPTRIAGNIGLALSAVALDTKPEDYTVIEVSSFQMENPGEFHPHIAVMLNLTPDHLNRHGTLEAYGALKARMGQRQGKRDVFVYNADDAFCRAEASKTKARTVPFSRTRRLKKGAWADAGQIWLPGRALCHVEELLLPGPHNLENALAAAAVAGELGIPPAVIRHTLRSFRGVEHRMETVRVLDGVTWINDSKGTNPDASIRAVQGMQVPTVLIAGGYDKETPFGALAEAVAANHALRDVVLIGKTAGQIRAALEQAGFTAIQDAGDDFAKALDMARALAEPGGAVLLSPACASFDMFKDYEERGREFKALVQQMEAKQP
ncbi:MAG: UDP-N-acetylmuramoyl-L-alanine--D-glutamate ligase [Oscillospiraceae bacterium]|jgi:UDP-N-acetylmuramoylalanine--D-glutamate ligase|nr:UDP-N-acetylmuramoyl-L-alanine--D-glutamate ligase [Oscillospiraceae bacterium]